MSAVSQFTTCSSLCSEEGVGDAGDLDHFGDVVDANDVRPTQNSDRDGGYGAPDAQLALAAALAGDPPFPVSEIFQVLVEAGFLDQRLDFRT